MLNEENELDVPRSPSRDSQKSDTENDLKATNLFAREMSLTEVVNTVLNTVDDDLPAAAEEIVTTEGEFPAEETAEEVATEKDEDTQSEEAKVEQSVTKPSRELKLLLELSKEANLDTNIPYKRKSVDPSKQSEDDHKYASTPGSGGKRSMRSQNPDFVVKHQKFLSKLTSDGESLTASDSEEKSVKDKQKKIKDYVTIGGAVDEKSRKLLKPVMALIQNNKDGFCWRCHREGISLSCETCPRSYHMKCLKHSLVNSVHWVCPECVAILKAENTKTRSQALKDMSLEQLCGLLKFALKRMAQCADSDPFLRPVNEAEFPDYQKYIVQPMDLARMQRNIRDNLYGSTNAFEADAKWLLHNSIIFNSYQSKLTSIAKSLLKVCKQEMAEIENCPTCYLNANTREDWFVEVCPKPHVLLWAKLKGFPYWPAKAMCTNSQGMVDVRFFGAHDRAWVPFKECFLYSLKDPNAHKQMKNDIIECIKELDVHIENLKKIYGEFHYAPYRTPFDPENEVRQLQLLLPTYKPAYHTSVPRKFLKIDTLLKRRSDKIGSTGERQVGKSENSVNSSSPDKNQGDSSKEMEGYGTEEEMETDEGDNRSEGRRKSVSNQFSASHPRPASINSQCSNSDQSTKSDASRLSVACDKAPMDTSEHRDLSSSGDAALPKQTESTESPKPRVPPIRLKISDKLIKRLSETNKDTADSNEMDIGEIEQSMNGPQEEVEKTTVESEGGLPTGNDISDLILGTVEVLKVNPNSKSPIDLNLGTNEKALEEIPMASLPMSNSEDNSVFTMSEGMGEKEPPTADTPVEDTPNSDELLEEMYSEAVDVSGVAKKYKQTKRESNVSNKRKRLVEVDDVGNSKQNKYIKLVDINVIKQMQNRASITIAKDASILKDRLATSSNENKSVAPKQTSAEGNKEAPPAAVEIKSEPSSDVEEEQVEDIEAKKQYLSALNISEKVTAVPKPKESRVKTRTDVANSARVVAKSHEMKSKRASSEVAKGPEEKKNALPRLIKQLPPNQRARKTFPRSTNSSPQPPAKNDAPKVVKVANPAPATPKSTAIESQTNTSNVVILTQSQPQSSVVNSLTMLPTNQAIAYTNMGNQILTMMQPNAFGNFIVPTTSFNPVPPLNPISEKTTPSTTDASLALNNLIASANAIFTSSTTGTTSTSTFTTTSTVPTPLLTMSTASMANTNTVSTITILNGQTTVPLIGGKPTASDVTDDYSYMSGYIPDHISKSISELMHRPPPKLKSRPPGPINNSFDPGMPSSAGRVTSYVNSVAHKLSDYFRGLLVETLNELGTGENAEAIITSLRFENERLKQKHADDILEIKKNVNSILRDIQKSIIDERERVIEETKAMCEQETIKRIDDAKSRQWCANCMKEAQFYCCWNTSYCDYPCQLKHWPRHMSKCTQYNAATQGGDKMVTPLILRKTGPPPQKAFANKQVVVTKGNAKDVSNPATPKRASPNRASPSRVVPTPLKPTTVTIVDPSKQRSFDSKPVISISASVAQQLSNKPFNKIKLMPSTAPTVVTSSGRITQRQTPQKFIAVSAKEVPTIDLESLEAE